MATPRPSRWSTTVTGGGTLRRAVVVFLALYPLVAVWALSNPMFASPDETLHMARAQSIARGDFTSPFTTDGLPIESIECFRFQEEVTAACQDLHWGADGTERAAPTEGYPPLFHSVAAIPALFTSGLAGAYVMRLWTAAVAVALAAWGGAIVTRAGRGPWPLVGYLVAMTPMVVFTMATVNPTGLSVAGAMVTVAAAIACCRAGRVGPLRSDVVALAVGVATLALTRRDGLIWLAILAVCLTPIVPWQRVRERVDGERRRALTVIGAVVAALLVAVVWWGRPTISRFYGNWRDGQGSSFWEGMQFIRTFLYQAVGRFGWLDTPIGEEALAIAFVVAGTLVVLAWSSSDRTMAWATGLAVFALLATPVAFKMIRANYLQGRYLLPIWAGAAVLAGAAVASVALTPDVRRRLVRIVLVLWLVVQAIGAVQNVRRYAVGRYGSWGFMFDADYRPPTMSNLVAVLALAVAFAIAAGMVWTLVRSTELADGSATDSDLFGEAPGHPVEDRPTDRQAGG